MKNKKILWVLLILVLFVAFAGCKKDEDEDDALLLLPMEPASSVQKFAGAIVANENDAMNLFESAIFKGNLEGLLKDVEKAAFNTAFKAANGKDLTAFILAYDKTAKSASFSANINDTTELKKKDADIKAGKITGSTNGVTSTSLTFGDILPHMDDPADALKNNGDTVSSNMTSSRTFAITDGYINTVTGWGSYKVAGYITMEQDYSSNNTLKNKAKDIVFKIENQTDKVSMTLSISDGANGAKFRISKSEIRSKSGDNKRDASGSFATTGLEVYDNSNNLIYTIPYYDYDDLTEFASEIVNAAFDF